MGGREGWKRGVSESGGAPGVVEKYLPGDKLSRYGSHPKKSEYYPFIWGISDR
jgi:hypothetical protein